MTTTRTPAEGETIRCVLIGGGGHARVLLDALRAAEPAVDCVIVDADAGRVGTSVYDAPIIGTDDVLESLTAQGVSWFVAAVGGNVDNRVRQRLFGRAVAAGLRPMAVVHPAATRSSYALIGDGLQMLAGSVVNAGAELGPNVIVNTGAIVEHDCRIAAHAHIATGARLGGGVSIGLGASVGVGATVKPGVRIGDWAVVGAGSVVVHDVDPHLLVVGVPARPLHR